MSPPALPPLAAAPVPAAVRLAYVEQHFRLAYPDAPAHAFGYAGSGAAVTVADHAGDFFTRSVPHPSAPSWRAWAGQQVPFFFDPQPAQTLLVRGEGVAAIGADVISAAFFLLSGWQEYFGVERDPYGRFAYDDSIQRHYNFVALPVVNYYFDLLRTAVEHATGRALPARRWGPTAAPCAAFVTHDVDNLHGGWRRTATQALRQRRPLALLRLLARRLGGQPGPWHNLAQVQAHAARYGAPSTFFMLAERRPAAQGPANADYALTPALRAQLQALAANGAEIALHGSYGTAHDPARLGAEAARLPAPPAGLRFHYLGWEPRTTPATVAEAGFAYDSSLGFAAHYGFRHSCCLPFFPFDFTRGQAHAFLEIPLVLMDTTLHHPHYLQLRPAQILPAVQPLIAETARFGGVLTLLWHNQNFDPLNLANGPRQFDEIMQALQASGAAFLTGQQICTAMRG